MTPFEGAEQVEGQPNLWFAVVPNSGDGCGNVVTCSYRIDPSTRTVTCNIIIALSWPVS